MAYKEFQELLHALGPPPQVLQRPGPTLQPTDYQDYPTPSPRYTAPCSFPDAIPGGDDVLHPLYLHQPQADSLLLQDQYWRYAKDAYENQDYPPPSPPGHLANPIITNI